MQINLVNIIYSFINKLDQGQNANIKISDLAVWFAC